MVNIASPASSITWTARPLKEHAARLEQNFLDGSGTSTGNVLPHPAPASTDVVVLYLELPLHVSIQSCSRVDYHQLLESGDYCMSQLFPNSVGPAPSDSETKKRSSELEHSPFTIQSHSLSSHAVARAFAFLTLSSLRVAS